MHNHSLHCHVHSDTAGLGDNDPSVKARLTLAKQTCQQQGWRMTTLREQVFEIILRSATPIGAYEILAKLQQQVLAQPVLDNHISPPKHVSPVKKIKPIAPPTVYRSLDFLIEHGFVHQLNSANAYIPCCHPREKHIVAFLICQQCQKVEEFSAESIAQMLYSVGEQADFAVQSSVIEILGVCSVCQPRTIV